jgi:hypothetical protein
MSNNNTLFHCPTCSICIACGGNINHIGTAKSTTDIILPRISHGGFKSFTTNAILDEYNVYLFSRTASEIAYRICFKLQKKYKISSTYENVKV